MNHLRRSIVFDRVYAPPPNDRSPDRRPYRSPISPDVWGIVAAALIYGAILDEAVAHRTPLAEVMAVAIPLAVFATGALR